MMIDLKEREDYQLLEVLHHYTSGMKACYTQDTLDGMLMIR